MHHSVNFNDLDSVRYVCEKYSVAALITEPILQNIGIVKPEPGYLSGLRDLADEFGFVLIFDEVDGIPSFDRRLYEHCHVVPDLVVFGKALANGYPIAVLAGRRDMMDRFVDPSPARRVLLAGTYNAHPVPTAAAIATLKRLLMNDGEVYSYTETLGEAMQQGMEEIIQAMGISGTVAVRGRPSALISWTIAPRIGTISPFTTISRRDLVFRRLLIDHGIYVPTSHKHGAQFRQRTQPAILK